VLGSIVKVSLTFERHLKSAIAAFALSASVAAGSVAAAQAAAPIGAFTTNGAWNFVSAPRLHPPKLRTGVPTIRNKLAAGYFLIANFKNLTSASPMVGEGGPLILDSHLQPVWFFPIGVNAVATNLTTQTYNGKPALSWWQGVITSTGATTQGQDVVVNQQYRKVATLTGTQGWILSPHEFLVSGHDAWVTAYKPVPMDLTPYGGPVTGVLLDSAVQEYDLKTGTLLYTWDAKDHISPSQSQAHPAPLPGIPWDAYHVNSIQLLSNGKFLTSMRNTWGAYLVDINTGNIQWTLGAGNATSFRLGPGAGFEWQHDVRIHSNNLVSIFDDACCAITGPGKFAPASGPSRGLVIKLDTSHGTANLVSQYTRGSTFDAAFLGNTQLLGNGNVLVGWGSQPYFSEYSKAARTLFDAVLPTPDLSYRAFVANWVGKPFFAPSGAVRRAKGKTTVYASWDGATEVVSWRVLAGTNGKHLTVVAKKTRGGFETAIGLIRGYKVYKVQALGSKGRVLGTSGPFPKHKSSSTGPGFY
jgi:Arylsulfotransferase (ASST)